MASASSSGIARSLVVDLALHPVGPLPQREARRQLRLAVVDERLDDQPLPRVRVQQQVPDAVAVPGVGVLQVVGRRQLDQHVEAEALLQVFEEGVQPLRRDVDAPVVAELRGGEAVGPEALAQVGQGLFVGHASPPTSKG
jgi:hypothetical protein